MSQPTSSTTLLALLGSLAAASAQFKTATPQMVAAGQINESPYRHNGLIVSSKLQGSAFHAWHPNTIFTAANAVFRQKDGTWAAPPTWYPQVHADTLDAAKGLQTRGYVYWNDYARFVSEGLEDAQFSKDIAIAFAFNSLGTGSPAVIDTTGTRKLMSGSPFVLTGYPKKNLYLDEKIPGFFLHRTSPIEAKFRTLSGQALIAPLIATGPRNNGGPVWIRNDSNQLVAAGVLTGGLPSETVVYGFGSELSALLRAVTPIVASPQILTTGVRGVGSTTMFFPYNRRKIIPDGVPRWTSFTIGVGGFDNEAKVKYLTLDVDIRTPHRGDLQVMLTSPEGVNFMVHNEKGANKKHLIIKSRDLTKQFTDVLANGPWTLRVQDRLEGDICEVRSFRVEIGTQELYFEEPDEPKDPEDPEAPEV